MHDKWRKAWPSRVLAVGFACAILSGNFYWFHYTLDTEPDLITFSLGILGVIGVGLGGIALLFFMIKDFLYGRQS